MNREYFFSTSKNARPDDSKIERTNQHFNLLDIKNGEELTRFYMKTDNILLVDVFEKFTKVSTKENGINPLYCLSICTYTYQWGLKYTDYKLQTLHDKYLIMFFENNIRGGMSLVMGDRCVKSYVYKMVLHVDAFNIYGHSMSQLLPYDEMFV